MIAATASRAADHAARELSARENGVNATMHSSTWIVYVPMAYYASSAGGCTADALPSTTMHKQVSLPGVGSTKAVHQGGIA